MSLTGGRRAAAPDFSPARIVDHHPPSRVPQRALSSHLARSFNLAALIVDRATRGHRSATGVVMSFTRASGTASSGSSRHKSPFDTPTRTERRAVAASTTGETARSHRSTSALSSSGEMWSLPPQPRPGESSGRLPGPPNGDRPPHPSRHPLDRLDCGTRLPSENAPPRASLSHRTRLPSENAGPWTPRAGPRARCDRPGQLLAEAAIRTSTNRCDGASMTHPTNETDPTPPIGVPGVSSRR